MDAILRRSWPHIVVRGVCVDFDPREMSTRGIRWMVGSFTCSLSSGIHFASGATRTTSEQLDRVFWGLPLALVFSLMLRTYTRVGFRLERGRDSQRNEPLYDMTM
jgi:hypothetical protein